jgi:putative iron-only hydrogenase system regulator
MKTRIAVISIIVENSSSIETLNSILFNCREYVIGRMGIPYREKKVNLISIAIDAPETVINAVTGKIGKLDGVSAKTNYSSVITEVPDVDE